MPRCFSSSIQSEVAWRGLARAHLAGHLNGAAEPQQLFGQRGLAGVGVGNDGKGAAAGDFGVEEGHGGQQKAESRRLYPCHDATPRTQAFGSTRR